MGYRIDGEPESGAAGSAVAPAGDVNGDGLADLAVGAPEIPTDGSDETIDYGAAYVVFGRRRPGRIRLRHLGARGLRMYGPSGDWDAELGSGVAGAGDVNGDGLADIAIGSPGLNGECRRDTGAVHVVHGRRRGGTVRLDDLGSGGFRVDGDQRGARFGARLAAPSGSAGVIAVAGGHPHNRRAASSLQLISLTTPQQTRRALPADSCLRVTLVDRRLRDVLRAGALHARVSTRLVDPGTSRSVLVQALLFRGRAVEDDEVLGYATIRFRRPGTRTLRLRLRGPGRRLLARRRGARVAIVGFSYPSGGDSEVLQAGQVTRLGP